MESLFKCTLCGRTLNTAQGLKSHITRLHRGMQTQSGNVTTSRSASQTCAKTLGSDSGIQDVQNEPFHEFLANIKATRRIIRRIPKGARTSAAEALAHVMETCVAENTDLSWKSLLVFAGECFQVPRKQSEKDVSLTTLVKHNIGNFVRKIPVTCQVPVKDRSKKNPRLPDDIIAKLVEAKITDGDIAGAVRVMSSEESLAPYDADTLVSLKAKHPSGEGFDDFPLISEAISPLQVSEADVRGALKSFPNGSSGGLDSLRPQHLKDLVSHGTGVVGERLLLALTRLCNHMLAGKVPRDICPVLYGASLCALNKKNGSIRPIAVGSTLRRLVAKVGGNHIVDRLGESFRPNQLGFGTRGGAEAAIHAARRFVNHKHTDTKVLLKVDFLNAFNMVRRDRLLSIVLKELPEIYLFLDQCYRQNSILAFGRDFISSQRGLQQGDPLGPALFCLMVNPITSALRSELNLWYLDDATLAGPVDVVLQDFHTLVHHAEDLGLEINSSKCELMILSTGNQDDNIINLFKKEIPNIGLSNPTNAFLLGAPLTEGSLEEGIHLKTEALIRIKSRLAKISAHCGFFILRNSQSIPSLTFLLRCAPAWRSLGSLELFDNSLKSALEVVCNTRMGPDAWIQSSLPVSKGGLGVRHAMDLALPAFIASAFSVADLVKDILPEYLRIREDTDLREATSEWRAFTGVDPLSICQKGSQKEWELPCIEIKTRVLQENATDDKQKARLLGVSSRESGAWLTALPSTSLGTLMDDDSFRIAIALRLGSEICQPHLCPCGAQVDSSGTHGLSCKKNAGRLARHAALNDLVKRALVSAGVPAILEPAGLLREDGKRPDGMTLVPWTGGKSMVWDVTCADTLAESYTVSTSSHQSWAASNAEAKKVQKYLCLADRYIFQPIAIETLGAFGPKSISIIHKIGRKIALVSGERRSTCYLIQRLSVAVQKGNAISVLNTIPPGASLNNFLNLL